MMDGLDLDAPAREPEGVGSAPPRVEAERRGDGLVRPGREEGAPPAPLDGAFRGTLLEAIAEAERRGVEGFRSPARAAVASPRDLAQTIERVREHFPPAAEDRRYALREDGTSHNTVTGRDEYAPVPPVVGAAERGSRDDGGRGEEGLRLEKGGPGDAAWRRENLHGHDRPTQVEPSLWQRFLGADLQAIARVKDALDDFHRYYDPANPDATPLEDVTGKPLLLAWASHEPFIERETIPPEQARAEERAAYGVDQLQDDQAPHAMVMREGDQPVDPDLARTRINAWVRFNMQRAFDYAADRNEEAAAFHLGLAKHTMQDLTSPSHNEPSGDPGIWVDGDLGVLIPHVGKEFFEPKPGSYADAATRAVQRWFDLGRVPSGDLSRFYGIDTRQGPVRRPGQIRD